VQGTIEAAIAAAFGLETAVEGSGRTDRGAHALGQVATVRLPAELSDEDIARRLDDALPDDCSVEAAERVPDELHARRSAISKTYRYLLWNAEELPPEHAGRVWHVHGDLDLDAMERALPHLVGEHDFATFASSGGFERASTVRTVLRAKLVAEAPVVAITFEADAFLYKMVRNLVRAVVRIGEGKRTPGDVAAMLAARDRAAAPGSAPASGLYLDAVRYDPPLFVE
jgi:tRNA pseudouridine38-40 synthase